MKIEDIARVTHEANRAYCIANGDNSQPTWDEAPDWQKSSAINGVTYHLKNPNSKPSDSHVEWMKEKLANGWKFGPVKDPAKKEHPCIVPYEGLPPVQQAKDAVFVSIVRALEPYVSS